MAKTCALSRFLKGIGTSLLLVASVVACAGLPGMGTGGQRIQGSDGVRVSWHYLKPRSARCARKLGWLRASHC